MRGMDENERQMFGIMLGAVGLSLSIVGGGAVIRGAEEMPASLCAASGTTLSCPTEFRQEGIPQDVAVGALGLVVGSMFVCSGFGLYRSAGGSTYERNQVKAFRNQLKGTFNVDGQVLVNGRDLIFLKHDSQD